MDFILFPSSLRFRSCWKNPFPTDESLDMILMHFHHQDRSDINWMRSERKERRLFVDIGKEGEERERVREQKKSESVKGHKLMMRMMERIIPGP